MQKLREWIRNLFDYSGNESYGILYAIIAVISIVISKSLGYKSVVAISICGTVIVTLGLIFQLFRKDKISKNILLYLFGSVFLAFTTRMVYLLNMYYTQNDIGNFAYDVKIYVVAIALLIDLISVIFLLIKQVSRKGKLILIIIMIYMSLIAIITILFLPSRI